MVARPVPPWAAIWFLLVRWPAVAPPIRAALFTPPASPPPTAGRACAVACGGRSLALAAAALYLVGGVGGGGVSFRSGVARSPVRGAVFAPGGRVAAGRGRVPPYGPPAGLGRNASPPGVPPSPAGGKRCGRWPRFEFAPADAGAGRLVSSRPFGHFWGCGQK